MTEFESRRKGTKTIAWIVLITLVIGVGGGWLIAALTKSSSSTPGSVYATTANGGSLITDGKDTLLTLKAVGNTVVKVDTDTRAAEPTDAGSLPADGTTSSATRLARPSSPAPLPTATSRWSSRSQMRRSARSVTS